jgi:hypothetical protein
MIAIGYILLTLGIIAGVVGEVMFLVVAYKRSLLWFFGCLFIPIVCWIFFFLNMKAESFGLEHEFNAWRQIQRHRRMAPVAALWRQPSNPQPFEKVVPRLGLEPRTN